MVSVINYKSDNGMTASIKSSYNSVKLYVKDKDGNIIDDFFTWNNSHRGEPYTQELSTTRADTIKKWQEECRLGRYKSAATGNVGGIFLCKAVDGMVETAPVPVENQAQRETIEEIQQRYISEQKSGQNALPVADF